MLEIKALIAEVRKLAAEQPDFIYEKPEGFNSCKYTSGKNCGGCLFGQAILRLSPELRDRLIFIDKEGSGIGSLLDSFGVSMLTQEKSWCLFVQSRQDGGSAWSQAVKQADETYPLK